MTHWEGEGEVWATDSPILSQLLLPLIKDALDLADEALGTHGTRVQRLKVDSLVV